MPLYVLYLVQLLLASVCCVHVSSVIFFFLMLRRPPRATRTYTLFPDTTLFRSASNASSTAAISSLRSSGFSMRVTAPIRSVATAVDTRSEEHTSELQSLMRISYAVFCLKKKTNIYHSAHAYDTCNTNVAEHQHNTSKTSKQDHHDNSTYSS